MTSINYNAAQFDNGRPLPGFCVSRTGEVNFGLYYTTLFVSDKEYSSFESIPLEGGSYLKFSNNWKKYLRYMNKQVPDGTYQPKKGDKVSVPGIFSEWQEVLVAGSFGNQVILRISGALHSTSYAVNVENIILEKSNG